MSIMLCLFMAERRNRKSGGRLPADNRLGNIKNEQHKKT